MINPIQNVCNYFKYGKVVHKSPNGNVIRKKLNYPIAFDIRSKHLSTTKTILDKNGKIDHQIERTAYIDEDFTSTTVKNVLYDNNGIILPQTKQPRTKTYLIEQDKKTLTDNTKPRCDYQYRKLDDGRIEYGIFYPEVTKINKLDGTVKKTMVKKVYIE